MSETIGLTGYKSYDPKKIVVSHTEAKDCECTERVTTNWDQVEKVVKRFKFVDTNPFGKSQNQSWTTAPPDNSIILKLYDPTSDDKLLKKDKEDQSNELQVQQRSCAPVVYLGGSYEDMGFSQSGGMEKPCDNLQCSKCLKKVHTFDNYAWKSSFLSSSADISSFLQQNMPEFSSICTNLEKCRGVRAYACHCSLLSTDKLTSLNSHPEVQFWECGKHQVLIQLRNN